MKLEKTIKDDRGTLNILVSLWVGEAWSYRTDHNGNEFRYDIVVSYIPKGKRKEQYGNYDELLTDQEKHDLKLQFWNLIKPI